MITYPIVEVKRVLKRCGSYTQVFTVLEIKNAAAFPNAGHMKKVGKPVLPRRDL